MSTALLDRGDTARVLAGMTRRQAPAPEHLADRWLHQPISNEPRFTYRLGMLLSSTCQGIYQHTVSRHARTALVQALRPRFAGPGLPAAPMLTQRQRAMLVDQPVWMVLPGPGCDYEPDIVMVDAQDRVVVVIEGKGPNAKRQCTPTRSLRRTRRWASDRDAQAFRDEVLGTDPADDASHATAECDRCWMTNRGARAGEHVSAFHQCDAYRYGRDWLPEGYTVHPEAVWLLLVPARTRRGSFFDGADSAADWHVADIEAFHRALTVSSPAGLTRWERSRLRDLANGMSGLYGLG